MSENTRTKLTPEQVIERDKASQEKFVQLAQYRVNRLLKYIDQLGNLANYVHDTDQTDQIVDVLWQAVQAMQKRFSAEAPDVTAWTLD